jgi:hypothetical protein
MSQPVWRCVANLGDVDPVEHGGLFVSVDQTGVYDPEMELIDEPPAEYRDYDRESGWSEDARWTIYRVCLERYQRYRGYIVPVAYDPGSWVHPIATYEPWFLDDLDLTAVSVGDTTEEIVDDLCAGDPVRLAQAWRAILDYHGWLNGDSYPRQVDLAAITARCASYLERMSS